MLMSVFVCGFVVIGAHPGMHNMWSVITMVMWAVNGMIGMVVTALVSVMLPH